MTAARLILNLEHCVRELQVHRQVNSAVTEQCNAEQKLADARKALLGHIQAKDDEIAGLWRRTDYDND